MEWIAQFIERHIIDADDRAVARGLVLTISQGGAAGATAYLDACRVLGEAAGDIDQLLTDISTQETSDPVARVGMLISTSFARVRAEYPSRPDAQRAREALASMADETVDEAGARFGADLHSWLIRIVGEAVSQISAVAANRSPLVRVETGISLPSSLLAYDLYEDPERGAEIVARSRSGTPLVMPVRFEALAS